MLKNYIKTTIRNLIRNQVNSIINLLGLAFGISACLLIVLYVQDELSFDNYHDKSERICRLSNEMDLAGQKDHIAVIGFRVGPTLARDYPEVESYLRFVSAGQRTTVTYDKKQFNENRFFFADTTTFDVFSWKLLKGNPKTALSRPKTVVLNQTLAEKYFGDENPMGKEIRFNSNDYEITGVMEDVPTNSDFLANALLSFSTLPPQAIEAWETDWLRMVSYTYLLFDRKENIPGLAEKLPAFSETYVQPWLAQNSVTGSIAYELTGLKDLHLRNDISYDNPKGNKAYLYIFSMVAIFILLIACINYVNLSIAQSSKRSTEVGIRKTAGAEQGHLIAQFIGESVLLTLLSMGLAIIFVELSLPLFNNLANKSFVFGDVFSPMLIFSMLGIVAFVGVVAGSYPALYLASLRPVDVLKGQLPGSGRQWLRKSLVVAQFTISIALIICTLVVSGQMRYLKNQELGFNKDQTMIVEVPRDTSVANRMGQMRSELLQNPGVTKISGASGNSVPGLPTGTLLYRLEREVKLEEKAVNFLSVDEHYLDLLGIQLLDGRNFEQSRQTDPQQAFIVNEAVVNLQGWGDNAIGKRVQWGLLANDSAANDGKVIGVVKDFHYASLHNKVDPLIIMFQPQNHSRLFVKMGGNQLAQNIDFVKNKWAGFDPNHPMEFSFLDETFDAQYRNEEKMMSIFTYFTALTILIACMGLFGLSSFITQQRTKEIGIRKVLGAETSSILYLLSRDFGIMVLIALLLASPIAWYGMNEWLQGFEYRAGIQWSVFFLAGMSALAIAMMTTSFHALRVARSNPVMALRYE